MKAMLAISAAAGMLVLSGCANREGVAPSQNQSLNTVSPSTTATSEGGAMQRSLDAWLKEEWTPLTAPTITKTTAPDGTVVTTTTDAKQVTTTTTAPNGTVVTTTAPVPEDNTPFTLQKYADKWKVYHENKAKMNEGKPKEASHVEIMSTLPVVGK